MTSVSRGSPTAERMEGRPPSEGPKPSACRSLFGPVDHPGLARDWHRQSRQLEAAGRQRWNFDFRRGQPLEGRFEWERLGPAALPDFYSRPARPARPAPAPAAPTLLLPRGGRAAQQEAPAPAPRKSDGPGKRPAADESPSPPNKRAAAEEMGREPLSAASPAEQTPRKASPPRLPTERTKNGVSLL